MKRMISVASAALLLGVAGLAAAQDVAPLLQRSDQLALQDAPALRALYDEGNAAFARGDFVRAFNTYDYAVWQGSLAAASRLCVLDAYGIGTRPNPQKAEFWCERAAAAGQDVTAVQAYLRDYGVEVR
jgi:TPR repeat protein